MAKIKEYQQEPKKVFLIKNKKMIDFLKNVIYVVHDAGFTGSPVDDYFLLTSYNVNNYFFYVSKSDTLWATKENIAEIKREMK